MKSLIKKVLVAGIVLGVFALCGEIQDTDIQIKYSLFWLVELVLCGKGLQSLESKKN